MAPIFLAAGPVPAKPAPPKPMEYSLGLLGKSLSVHIDEGIPEKVQRSIKSKIASAVARLNGAAAKLTAEQKQIINLLTALKVVAARLPGGKPSLARSGIDVFGGVFTLLDTYLTAPGVTPAFFASDIAHDSYHVWQHQHGQDNTRENAPKLEHDANQFQIAVGKLVGLTPANIAYILKDTHTFYNTGQY